MDERGQDVEPRKRPRNRHGGSGCGVSDSMISAESLGLGRHNCHIWTPGSPAGHKIFGYSVQFSSVTQLHPALGPHGL